MDSLWESYFIPVHLTQSYLFPSGSEQLHMEKYGGLSFIKANTAVGAAKKQQ